MKCLTGKRPFESDALGDLLMQIMVKPLPFPSQEKPGPPSSFDKCVPQSLRAKRRRSLRRRPKELSEALIAAFGSLAGTQGSDERGAR